MHDSTESDDAVRGSIHGLPSPVGGFKRLSMTVDEFADLVGLSRATAFKLVKAEEVESFKIRGRRFIHYDAYVAYLDHRVEESRSEKASV